MSNINKAYEGICKNRPEDSLHNYLLGKLDEQLLPHGFAVVRGLRVSLDESTSELDVDIEMGPQILLFYNDQCDSVDKYLQWHFDGYY